MGGTVFGEEPGRDRRITEAPREARFATIGNPISPPPTTQNDLYVDMDVDDAGWELFDF